jgi:hypothetical protein
MTRHPLLPTVLAVIAIAALAWIDPLYLPLITFGPILSGLAAGAAGHPPRRVAAVWLAAGLCVLVTDLVVHHEDVAFHAAVATITAAIGAGFTVLGARVRVHGARRRT